MYDDDGLTEPVIGSAIGVHQTVGPGLPEAVYAACPCRDMKRARIGFAREVPNPAIYQLVAIPLGFNVHIVVAGAVILEIKSVAAITVSHEAQILTDLRMSQIKIGLLINFSASRLATGLRRFVL